MCCEHSNVFLSIIELCFQFGNVLWTLGGVFDLKCVVTLLGHRKKVIEKTKYIMNNVSELLGLSSGVVKKNSKRKELPEKFRNTD
jgi:hypothetical protein